MITLLSETESDFIAVLVSEKLTEKDNDTLLPHLENAIKAHGKIRLFWEMRDFEGWEGKGFWNITQFDAKHADSFTHIALVGEKKWQEWMTQLMKPFTSADIRYFEEHERQVAIKWARDTPPK